MICGLVEGNILTGSHPCTMMSSCMANLSATGHHSHTITASCLTICLLFSVFYKINENLRNQWLARERTSENPWIISCGIFPSANFLNERYISMLLLVVDSVPFEHNELPSGNRLINMEHGPLVDDYPLYNKMVMFHSCLRLPQASQLPWYHIESAGLILKSRFSMIFP